MVQHRKNRWYEKCTEQELLEVTDTVLIDEQNLKAESHRVAYERFTVVSGIVVIVEQNLIL